MNLRSTAAGPPTYPCDANRRIFVAAAGETIFREGETAIGSVRIVSGAARLVRYETDGMRNLLAFVLPGEVNESLPSVRHRFDLEASSDLQFTMIPSDNSRRSSMLFDQVVGFEERLVERCRLLNHRPVLVRLAAFLSSIGARLVARRDGRIPVAIPQTDIAAYLATTPESICRGLRQLRELGMVEHPPSGEVTIVDKCRLGAVVREREMAA